LAALQGERIDSAEDALRETLKHERLFWDQQVSDLGLDGTWEPIVRQALETLVAAVALVGGVQHREHAQSVLDRAIGNSPLQGQHSDALIRLLRHLYASPEESEKFCDPLQPDLLGEELVAVNLDGEFLRRILGESSFEEGYAALMVLTRLAQRRPSLSSWIGAALGSNLEMLAQAAIEVAVETGDPVGTQLALTLEKNGSIEVLLQIQRRCDEDKYQLSVPLREVAHVATEKGLTLLRARRADLSEEEQIEYGRLANNLGVRLGGLGRREDALNATIEAVQIYRLLAQQRPDAFNPDLAMSLNNLGGSLSALGRRDDALNATNEAVQIYRLLAQHRPNAFNPDLAMSLNNLGIMLSELGRREDALNATDEAVKIYRLLAQQRPEAFKPDLAMSLNNMGIRISELGRREDALNAIDEAVKIYRLLAQQRPDAFNPNLAMSLNNLGKMLSDLGRREDALNTTDEAVKIYRLLAQQRPDAFNHNLAMSLNNMGNRLNGLGQREDALNATDEAVKIWRLLAQQQPDAFKPDLAMSLNNMGKMLSELGRPEEALRASEEALRTGSPFFLRFPQVFGSRMMMVVRSYFKHAEAAGREPDEELLAPIRRTFEVPSDFQDQEASK